MKMFLLHQFQWKIMDFHDLPRFLGNSGCRSHPPHQVLRGPMRHRHPSQLSSRQLGVIQAYLRDFKDIVESVKKERRAQAPPAVGWGLVVVLARVEGAPRLCGNAVQTQRQSASFWLFPFRKFCRINGSSQKPWIHNRFAHGQEILEYHQDQFGSWDGG